MTKGSSPRPVDERGTPSDSPKKSSGSDAPAKGADSLTKFVVASTPVPPAPDDLIESIEISRFEAELRVSEVQVNVAA
jgi:hypothetical protein